MIREIDTRQLRVGMFVHRLDTSWIKSPFWRSRMLLEEDEDLRRIADTGCKRVWIDTGLGLDIEVPSPEAADTLPVESPEGSLDTAILVRDRSDEAPAGKAGDAVPDLAPTSLEQEMKFASGIRARARDTMVSIFDEARLGRPPDLVDTMPVVDEITQSLTRNRNALTSLVRLKNKDDYTFMHSVAVCTLMVTLAKELKLPEEQVRLAGLGGLLHDIGKMRVPPEILNKPDRLTASEFVIVKGHPSEGAAILSAAGSVPDQVIEVCRHHHERIDGKGYPGGLANEDIPVLARMGAVCDVYDAVTSDRPYKKAWTPSVALHEMAIWKNGAYDEKIFRAFVRCIGVYPNGSLVRLESARLAVVVSQHESELLKPVVRVIYDVQSHRVLGNGERLDLSEADCRDRIVRREIPENWRDLPPLEAYWMPI